MRFTTKIELPVEKSKYGGYVLTKHALDTLLSKLKDVGNLVNIEWQDGNCFVTIELLTGITLEDRNTIYSQFVKGLTFQTNRKKIK